RIDWAAMQRRKDGVVGQLNSGVRGLLKQNGVEVVQGFGEVLDPHTIVVGGERISADHLIIATGSSPAILPIPGLQEAL
ncbi:MAG TPA: dihydrolipoyl dehydrogenase, partial [Firmicutes bacterium]|nr:dihydrolipoyl dehydrogenase [Bacillota bacterium]